MKVSDWSRMGIVDKGKDQNDPMSVESGLVSTKVVRESEMKDVEYEVSILTCFESLVGMKGNQCNL